MCRYPPSTIHRYLDLPCPQTIQTRNTDRHNTTPPSQTLDQASHTSPVPAGLVKPKLNSLTTQTPYPARAIHIHIHTLHLHIAHQAPHLSLARRRKWTQNLNHVYHPYTHTPHSPHPHFPGSHTSISVTIVPSHATQRTLHVLQQPLHPHRVPRQPHRLYSDGTTHSKQHRTVQPNCSPARTITVALDMSTALDTKHIHTLINR